MLRSIALFLLLFSYAAYGQQHDNIVRYPNGKIKYILTLVNGDLEKNICFSYMGDTIYSWDARTCTFIDYRVSGAYLLKAEYDTYRQKVKNQDYIEKQRESLKIISGQPPPPSANEYELTHEAFFKKCLDYRLIYREGDFTIITNYKNKIQSGPYLKYYKDKLVVSGVYDNGKEKGLWKYFPYKYYPYYDVVITDLYKKHWSIFYSLVPALFVILVLLATGEFASRRYNYPLYYYIVISLAIISLYLRLEYNKQPGNAWVTETIPAVWFVIWHTMILLSTINLFMLSKRANTLVFINIICLVAGLVFSGYILFFRHMQFA